MNISINLSEVLTKAWKITWKFKVLWIFGILASFVSSRNGGNGGNNGGSGGSGSGTDNLPEPFRELQNLNWQDAIGSFLNQYLIFIIVGASLLCVISFVFYFLGTMGKTGLIKGVHKADLGADKLGFGELWGESLPYFWRMMGLSILVGLPVFLLVVILLVVLFAALIGVVGSGGEPSGGSVGALLAAAGVFIPAICCIGILSIFISMIVEQARNAIVIEDLGVIESLRKGWEVFKRNFLTIILMSIILGVLGGIIGVVIAIPLILAVAPAFLSIVMMATKSADTALTLAPLVFAGICFVAYLPILLILSGIQETYIQSAFTLTYLRLTAPAAEPPAELINAE